MQNHGALQLIVRTSLSKKVRGQGRISFALVESALEVKSL